jgi:hypothetical protein
MPPPFVRALEAVSKQLALPIDENWETFMHHYQHSRIVASLRPEEEVMVLDMLGRYVRSGSLSRDMLLKTNSLRMRGRLTGYEDELARLGRLRISAVVYLVLCQVCEDARDLTPSLVATCIPTAPRLSSVAAAAVAAAVANDDDDVHPCAIEARYRRWREDGVAATMSRVVDVQESTSRFFHAVHEVATRLDWRISSNVAVVQAMAVRLGVQC